MRHSMIISSYLATDKHAKVLMSATMPVSIKNSIKKLVQKAAFEKRSLLFQTCFGFAVAVLHFCVA